MSDYGRKTDRGMSFLAKLYNLPFYLLRKLFYNLIKALVTICKYLARGFGFYFSAELEDKPEWKWFRSVDVPGVRVEVERRK